MVRFLPQGLLSPRLRCASPWLGVALRAKPAVFCVLVFMTFLPKLSDDSQDFQSFFTFFAKMDIIRIDIFDDLAIKDGSKDADFS